MQALSVEHYDELRELARLYHRRYRDELTHGARRNPALSVDLLCFQPWEDELCGALITPLSLSLALVPVTVGLCPPENGDKRWVSLPDGDYPFVAECLESGRWLWRCSLLEDVQDIDSVEEASRLAQYLLDRVMTPGLAADS
ncbi:[NiFe]-hydrogenase assembly chaperone HybE [Aidingimonas lacisalsi]|uniref:[NiFe]-hydrogenase assembly chaperone HybE n=1 Tax=Aidingimonas lacisalsi TaxID=2604086 RepID=UPI00137567E0|nr:[NiFe]-hydrogenase assembly chaperone HybE [Aidingimonas lacisalsi]